MFVQMLLELLLDPYWFAWHVVLLVTVDPNICVE